MRALVLDGVNEVSYRADVPDPVVEHPTDAVVAVRRAGLCGSDLHPYEGREAVRFGVVCGHEVVGDVVAVGGDVRAFSPGDRVIVPFTTSCGRCQACRSGLSARCARGSLFGYGSPVDLSAPALPGGQAELVRVPLADGTLVAVPDDVDDTTALLLADNLPTGWYAARRADVVPGEAAVVVGLGAVGLCAVTALLRLGAEPVLAVDPVGDRRRRAEALGAAGAGPDDAVDALAGAAGIPTAPAVVEAAGTLPAQRLAACLLRPGGTLSVIAFHTGDGFAFSPAQAYDANLTLRAGRAPVRSLLDELLPRVASGDVAVPPVVTHPDLPLVEGPEAYRWFAARQPGLVKVTFRP